MKARRRSLSQQQLARAGRDIARELRRSHALKPGQRIALYCPARGEAPIADIARHARMLGCELHLPLIVDLRARKMMFVRWSSDTKLQRHRWGFMQPVSRKRIPLRALDVVFVPAVAVDARGMRLGAGAGFYDRLFHFRRESPWRKPRLIAVVHDFQRVQHIDGHSWDVPVDAVLSESGLHRVHR